MGWPMVDIFRATAVALGVLGLVGLNGERAAGDFHSPVEPQSAPVAVFVFTSSTDPSIDEYVIDEFKKELPKRGKDFPFTLVDSRQQARVVLEIKSVVEFCAPTADAMVAVSGTLTVDSFSAPIGASGACSPYKRTKYRPLGKRLAEALAKWGKQHRADLAVPAEPVVGSFVGKLGYQIEIPAEYRAHAVPFDGKAETVFFAPVGTALTRDESQFAERHIVRLEAWKETKMSLASWKETVSRSLDSEHEAYTLSDVDVGRPGFLVHITAPREIRQLLVQGTGIMLMFTGADEEQLRVLARGMK